MSFQVDVLSDVKVAGGTPIGSVPAWDAGSRYGFALDGNALTRIGVSVDDLVPDLMQVRRVLRLSRGRTTDAGALEVTTIGEWRIKKPTRELGSGLVWVEAHPILLDLADVYVRRVTSGGLVDYRIEASQLTPAEWIDEYILPSLAAAGIDWVTRSTITPTTPRTLSFQRWTCLQLLRELSAKSDYHPGLVELGSSYGIQITAIGAGAAAAQLVVGRNIEALEWEYDGLAQATVVLPQGVTNSGELEPRTSAEYAAKVTAIGAGDVALADPDGNDDSPIKFDDQENGATLEALLPHLQLRDLSGVALTGAADIELLQRADNLVPTDVAYVSSTGELAAAALQTTGSTGRLVFYSATTRQYTGIVSLGGTPAGGVYYHAGQDRVYVVLTSGNVVVINPNTKAVVTTIAVGASPKRIAFATSSGYLYVTNNTGNSVTVINPATNTVVTTITSIAGALDITYDSGNDRIVATAGADLKFINPGTNTVANTLNIGGTLNSVAYLAAVSRLYAARTASNDVKRVNGSGTPAVEQTTTVTSPAWVFGEEQNDLVWVISSTGYLTPLTPGSPDAVGIARFIGNTVTKPGAVVTAQRLVWVALGATGQRGWLAPIDVDSLGPAIRRAITDTAQATQKVSLAIVAPIQPNDLVSFRDDAAGTWRSRLRHPVKAAAYGDIERVLTSDLWRGERNYTLNAWAAEAGATDYEMPGWDRSRSGTALQPALVYRDPDASTWTSQACQANGAQSSGAQVLNLKGLTPGDVIEPGDFVASPVSKLVTARAVVDGSGNVSLKLLLGVSVANNDPITIQRSALKGNNFLSGNRAAVLFTDGVATEEAGCWLPVPSVLGRTIAWVTVEVDVWPESGFQPSTKMSLRVYEGPTLIASVFHDDTATYADQVVRRFAMSYSHTIPAGEGPRMIGAFLRLEASIRATAYFRRVQVTLGPEGALDPPMLVNASAGELYHAGWRAVRDLADPPINYRVQAIEEDADLGATLGSRPVLEHPAAGIVATPRVVAIDYPFPPPGTSSRAAGRRPPVELDNRSPSLARTLANAGIA